MKPMIPHNIYSNIPAELPEELHEQLLAGRGFQLTRIVSKGQATPPGMWYDQTTDEWVVLLKGRAEIRLENAADSIRLKEGDSLHLPAHCRHRVEWTDPKQDTVWLALYIEKEKELTA